MWFLLFSFLTINQFSLSTKASHLANDVHPISIVWKKRTTIITFWLMLWRRNTPKVSWAGMRILHYTKFDLAKKFIGSQMMWSDNGLKRYAINFKSPRGLLILIMIESFDVNESIEKLQRNPVIKSWVQVLANLMILYLVEMMWIEVDYEQQGDFVLLLTELCSTFSLSLVVTFYWGKVEVMLHKEILLWCFLC